MFSAGQTKEMASIVIALGVMFVEAGESTNDLGTVVVQAGAMSVYRPEKVSSGTFSDVAPEKLPCVVDALTGDFIREKNPTDLNDLLRWVPGIETGGTSLLVRQPGNFSIRGGGGSEPAIDGVFNVGRGAGLFMDPFLMDRVEIVKGPIASLAGGAGASQNANGGSGSVNLYLKGAHLHDSEILLQENTSLGKHLFRQRAMVDANEVMIEDKAALRVVTTADYYEPAYINQGMQKGARGRESFNVAPSFIFKPVDEVSFGLKTLFQKTDAPSYIGIPVYHGHPAAGYGWYESSARRGDRQQFETMMINPWLDWQVTDDWLLKFGASFILSSWEQTTQEPYVPSSTINGKRNPNYDADMAYFWGHGYWPNGEKVMSSDFSESKSLSRNYNLFARSIYDSKFDCGLENQFVVQTDAAWREGGAFSNSPWTRYGVTLQDMPQWGWFGILGGVRYDYMRLSSYGTRKQQDAHAISPRAGLTVQPLDWLVFFGNVSQTRTPMFDSPDQSGNPLTKPWFTTQYETGLRLKTGKSLWTTLSVYRIEQENTPVEGGRNAAGYWYLQEGSSTSRGAEISLSGDVTDNWSMMAMYAFNRWTNRHTPPGEKGRDFERYPAHSVTLNTSYRVDSGWLEDVVFGGGLRFRSSSYATFRGTYVNENAKFDPSLVVDINMSVPFSKFGGSEDWVMTFGIRNLLGEKYFENSRHYYESFVGEPRSFEIGIRGKL